MGRHRGGKNRKGKNNGRRNGDRAEWKSIEEVAANGNYLMEVYYALQGLHNHRYVDGSLVECRTDVDKEEERLRWRNTSTLILPVSFRFGKDLPQFYREQMANELDAFQREAADYKVQEGEPEITTQLAVNKLPFVDYGYQLSLDRPTLRKHPAFKKLHTWLIDHDTEGHVTRQETVSMIPPVLLDIQKTDKVLDMCAAPGSKTTQMMEDDPALLIANDSNHNRAYMLIHQLRRIMYHHPSIMVTNTQAQNFPSLVQFDKILCDVPCTGDGTPRKNIDVWQQWNVRSGISMHALQKTIAERGVFRLLKVGGTLCYSTCSLNPMENEAVVADLIRSSKGALELVDCTDKLGSFRTRPGLTTWKVLFEDQPNSRDRTNEKKKNNPKMQAKRKEFEGEATESGLPDTSKVAPGEEKISDTKVEEKEPVEVFKPGSWDESVLLEDAKKRGMLHFESYDDVPEVLSRRIKRSMFPPTPEEAASFHLERCLRCLGQDNDSGGFFVAILRKTAPMSSSDSKDNQSNEPTKEEEEIVEEPLAKKPKLTENENSKTIGTDGGEKAEVAGEEDLASEKKVRSRKGKKKVLGKDAFEPLEEGTMNPIIDFFGLAGGFRPDLYFTRINGAGKVFQYIAPEVKTLIDQGIQEEVTVISSGLKAFAKNAKNSHCVVDQRACQEAIHLLVPYMTKRKLVVSIADFRKCLLCQAKACPLDDFSDEFAAAAKAIDTGSFVVILEGYEERNSEKMMATMWKCRGDSVDGLVGKDETASILKKLEGLEAKAT